MSDLVSRKAVLKYINDHKEFTAYKEDGINKSTNNYVNSAMLNSFISSLPAAYDLDKVVEQLENFKKASRKIAVKCSNDRYCVGQNVAFDKAIEILKAGGKNE